jgi:predicted ester cyclase
MVAVRWRMHGTHTGEYMGVPPTGKVITTPGMSMYRIAGGKIVEDWSVMDQLGSMQQLGLVPSA